MLRGVWTVLLTIVLPGFASAAQVELVSKASLAGLTSHSSQPAISGDDLSGEPTISADGAFIAFTSRATNLDPADGNGVILKDVFLYSRNP